MLRVSILSSVALAQQATPLTVVRGLTRGAVLTVSATGGDGAYTYTLVSDDNNVVATVANNRAVRIAAGGGYNGGAFDGDVIGG